MNAKLSTSYLETPIGWAEIKATPTHVISIKLLEEKGKEESKSLPKPLLDCIQQLQEYFAGTRKTFDLPLAMEGTEFQQKVWYTLLKIPFAETICYKELAELTKNPRASRAVGTANGKNQHWIVVPCHRVINHSGKLGGYAGGLWRKEWLLNHEKQQTKMF